MNADTTLPTNSRKSRKAQFTTIHATIDWESVLLKMVQPEIDLMNKIVEELREEVRELNETARGEIIALGPGQLDNSLQMWDEESNYMDAERTTRFFQLAKKKCPSIDKIVNRISVIVENAAVIVRNVVHLIISVFGIRDKNCHNLNMFECFWKKLDFAVHMIERSLERLRLIESSVRDLKKLLSQYSMDCLRCNIGYKETKTGCTNNLFSENAVEQILQVYSF